MAELPSPLGSHEIPMRGANMLYLRFIRYLFGPGVPDTKFVPYKLLNCEQ
jgi:hypothetical protein